MTAETIAEQLTSVLGKMLDARRVVSRTDSTQALWTRAWAVYNEAERLLKLEAANPAPHVWQLWFAGESEITQDPEEAARWRADGYTVHELGRVLVSSIPKENLT